jgi:GT2 family glycosyltransferase
MVKIAAVVVTYNRLGLLKECIDSLRNQTRKLDEIIVVNNDSTDGTKEWLNEQKDLSVIHQANLGGAGGFHTGIKTAYEKGYDWIWIMDDDGLPMKDALEELVKYKNSDTGVLNSLVVSKTIEKQLAFGLEDYIFNKYYIKIEEINDKEFVNGANFFNGTLLAKKTIDKIGFPEPLFFIYGDEYEYYLRIKNNSIEIKTITSSTILHPEQQHKYIGKGKWFYRYNFFNELRIEYYPKNSLILSFLYKEYTFKRLIKTYILDIYGLIFIQKKLFWSLKYLLAISKGFILFKIIKSNND